MGLTLDLGELHQVAEGMEKVEDGVRGPSLTPLVCRDSLNVGWLIVPGPTNRDGPAREGEAASMCLAMNCAQAPVVPSLLEQRNNRARNPSRPEPSQLNTRRNGVGRVGRIPTHDDDECQGHHKVSDFLDRLKVFVSPSDPWSP